MQYIRSDSQMKFEALIPKVENFEGLGKRYLELLEEKAETIYQVDMVSGVTESNGSVKNRAVQLANGLRSHGIQMQEVIAVVSRGHCDQTIVVLATLLIGAIIAPIDPNLQYKEFVQRLKLLKPRMIFCDMRVLGIIENVINDLKMSSKVIVFDKHHAHRSVFNKLLLQDCGEPFKPASIVNPRGTVAFIIPTQGTIDEPKLVCISHSSMLYQTLYFLKYIALPDTILSHFPLSWILEIVLMCSCFEYSVTRILVGELIPRRTCKIIQDMHVDYAFIPTGYALKMIEDTAVRDFSLVSLKCIYVGGVLTTAQDISHLRQQLPRVKFSQFYASTEGGCIAICPFNDYFLSLDHPDSAGKLLPGVKMKISDVSNGKSGISDAIGAILIQSEGLMMGYYKNPRKATAVMQKHYLRTGDIGCIDSEGWVYVSGREEDIYFIDDCQYLCLDLEEIIFSHPFVKEAAVISHDQQVVAFVVAVPGTNLDTPKLTKFLEDRTIQKPTKILFPDNLPKTILGNVRRGELRDQLTKVKIIYTHSIASLN